MKLHVKFFSLFLIWIIIFRKIWWASGNSLAMDREGPRNGRRCFLWKCLWREGAREREREWDVAKLNEYPHIGRPAHRQEENGPSLSHARAIPNITVSVWRDREGNMLLTTYACKLCNLTWWRLAKLHTNLLGAVDSFTLFFSRNNIRSLWLFMNHELCWLLKIVYTSRVWELNLGRIRSSVSSSSITGMPEEQSNPSHTHKKLTRWVKARPCLFRL